MMAAEDRGEEKRKKSTRSDLPVAFKDYESSCENFKGHSAAMPHETVYTSPRPLECYAEQQHDDEERS